MAVYRFYGSKVYRLSLLVSTGANYTRYFTHKMRILCLHGVGSSGAILERQMANLRRELDPSFELVFVDGLFECGRGPGT